MLFKGFKLCIKADFLREELARVEIRPHERRMQFKEIKRCIFWLPEGEASACGGCYLKKFVEFLNGDRSEN